MKTEEKDALVARAKELIPTLPNNLFNSGIKANPEKIEHYMYEIAQQVQTNGEDRVREVIGDELLQIVKKLFFEDNDLPVS